MDQFIDAPEQGMRTIRRFIPRKLQPMLRGFRKRWQLRKLQLSEPFRSVYPYTVGAMIRQQNLYRLAQDVETKRIPGAIVECGVLDGGMAALMASATKNRPVHLFDSWEGLPEPTEKDTNAASIWASQVVGSPRRVIAIMRKLGVDLSRLSFHKGWFDQTFPKANIDRIALLHIDADFYESVKLCLDTWADKVSPGGYIALDDYAAFVGCRRAVDEYLAAHPNLHLEIVGEFAQAFFVRM